MKRKPRRASFLLAGLGAAGLAGLLPAVFGGGVDPAPGPRAPLPGTARGPAAGSTVEVDPAPAPRPAPAAAPPPSTPAPAASSAPPAATPAPTGRLEVRLAGYRAALDAAPTLRVEAPPGAPVETGRWTTPDRWVAADLAPGAYTARLSVQGRVVARGGLEAGTDAVAAVTLEVPAPLRGEVVDARGRPAVGARVFATDPRLGGAVLARATADAAGRFALFGLPARPVRLGAATPDGDDRTLARAPVAGRTPLPQRLVLAPADLRPEPGADPEPSAASERGDLVVRAVDPSGRPLRGRALTVVASGPSASAARRPEVRRATTGADGTTRIDGLPAGLCRVVLAGEPPNAGQVEVSAGRAARLEIAAEAATARILGALAAGPAVLVRIRPLGGGPDRWVETDPEGRFQSGGLAPGAYEVGLPEGDRRRVDLAAGDERRVALLSR